MENTRSKRYWNRRTRIILDLHKGKTSNSSSVALWRVANEQRNRRWWDCGVFHGDYNERCEIASKNRDRQLLKAWISRMRIPFEDVWIFGEEDKHTRPLFHCLVVCLNDFGDLSQAGIHDCIHTFGAITTSDAEKSKCRAVPEGLVWMCVQLPKNSSRAVQERRWKILWRTEKRMDKMCIVQRLRVLWKSEFNIISRGQTAEWSVKRLINWVECRSVIYKGLGRRQSLVG